MYEGAAWQLREEGSTMVVMAEGSSLQDLEEELIRILAESGVRRASFEYDGLMVQVRGFSWWENVRVDVVEAWSSLSGGWRWRRRRVWRWRRG